MSEHPRHYVPVLAVRDLAARVTVRSATSQFRLKIIWPIPCLTASMTIEDIDFIGRAAATQTHMTKLFH